MGLVEALPLDDDALRQLRDAQRHFADAEAARAAAAALSGGMVWKRVKGRDYLVRTSRTGAQTSLGPRSETTERQHAAFFPARDAARARLAEARAQLERDRRVNRALRVGRAPAGLMDLLSALAEAGLGGSVAALGSEALYAYEALLGLRFSAALLGLASRPSPGGVPPRRLAIDEAALRDGAAQRLERVDPRLQLPRRGRGPAVEGPVVVTPSGAPRAGALPGDADTADLAGLAAAPRISTVVVGADGRMARMNAVAPAALVAHLDARSQARRQAGQSVDARDVALAEAIDRLLESAGGPAAAGVSAAGSADRAAG